MTETNPNDELKNLLVENLADTKILKEEIAKIHGYMRWRTIISIVWILIFILPLIASFFFIPDILKELNSSANLIRQLGL